MEKRQKIFFFSPPRPPTFPRLSNARVFSFSFSARAHTYYGNADTQIGRKKKKKGTELRTNRVSVRRPAIEIISSPLSVREQTCFVVVVVKSDRVALN